MKETNLIRLYVFWINRLWFWTHASLHYAKQLPGFWVATQVQQKVKHPVVLQDHYPLCL